MNNFNASKINRSAVSWICAVAGRLKWRVVLLAALEVVLGAAVVAFAWVLRGLVDAACAQDAALFGEYAGAVVGITVGQLALRAVSRHQLELTRSSLENAFKRRFLDSLLWRNYASVSATHSGEWLNRLTSDAAVVADALATIIPSLCGMLVKLLGALALVIYMVPAFAWVLIPGGVLMVVFTAAFRKRLKAMHKDIQEADGALRVFLSERLSSMKIVRAFVAQDAVEARGVRLMDAHKAARMRRNRFSNVCNVLFGVCMRGAYVLGALYCGWQILLGAMTFGTFTAVVQLVSQIQSPFANLSGFVPRYYAMVASAERLMEPEGFAAPLPGMLSDAQVQAFYDGEFEAIELADVAFAYPSSGEVAGEGTGAEGGEGCAAGSEGSADSEGTVLSGFNLTIPRGSTVAFVGHSGCGKSTVTMLIMGLFDPTHGACNLMHGGGQRTALDRTFAKLFAYVPQGNNLMNGTIEQAITFGLPVDGSQIWSALELACAADFVRALPAGLQTQLGEHGAGLSEGQLQRLAIARAIYTRRPVLVLDECTSSLDAGTEAQLLRNLQTLTDKTVVVVTHRLAVCDFCDQVIDFEALR